MAIESECPHCPEPYTWDQESWANVGCLILMVLPVFLMILFWLFFLFGIFIR